MVTFVPRALLSSRLLMRVGWGQENPAFRQTFTSQFILGANKEQADWFDEFQRISRGSPDRDVQARLRHERDGLGSI